MFGFVVVILVNLFVCDGRILRWIPNTDFENPRNWRTGRLPCNNEHVRFPPTIVSVFVQRNNTMLEIVSHSITDTIMSMLRKTHACTSLMHS